MRTSSNIPFYEKELSACGVRKKKKDRQRDQNALRKGQSVAEARSSVFQASQVNISLYPEHQTPWL